MNTDKTQEAVYQSLLPELLAIPNVRRLNADAAVAVETVAGALPAVRALATAGALPDVDTNLVSRLEDCCAALCVAQRNHCATEQRSAAAAELATLSKKALPLRDSWLTALAPLTNRKLIDPTALQGLSGRQGYQNVAHDLLLIVAVLKANWPAIEHRCCFRPDELAPGEELALSLLRACSKRRRLHAGSSSTAEMRDRAFTLLASEYDKVRRAVEFARWNEGDAAVIAPSLYRARHSRGRACAAGSVVANVG